MRKTLIALAAATGLVGLGSISTSAAPVAAAQPAPAVASIQKADWYCGPRCQYWHHRRWEERQAWRYNHPYYGYNYNYPYGYYR
jgi:hypothetical protein